MKVLYDNRPTCVKNASGIPIFAKRIFDVISRDKRITLLTSGCFLEKIPKRPYRLLRFVPLFYYVLYLPAKLSLGRYDYYIENSYFFLPLWKPKNTKIITVVHDIGLILFDNIQTKKITKHWRWKFNISMKKTDIIVTVSETSKKDIQRYLDTIGLGTIPIYCIYNDVQLEIPQTGNSQEVLKKYGIDHDYFLFLGTLEPRKNPLNMIKAFHTFKIKYRTDIKFVFAGGKGWLYDDVLQYITEHQLEDDVVFTGYVSETEKYFLLKSATAFIFLSIYEGFGIPPLEALKIGVPVLLSDIPVFHELFEESVWYANGEDIEEIAEQMHNILTTKSVKDTHAVLTKFSWEKSGNQLLDIIYEGQ